MEGNVAQGRLPVQFLSYVLQRRACLVAMRIEVHFKASTIRSTLVRTMPRYVSPLLPSAPMEPE